MPSDVRIFDGTSWVSLQGPTGPAGPTVVSTDAGNVAKLGTDGRISVQPADMDSRWVNTTGDTMTGTLNISGAEAAITGFTVTASGASALAQVARYDNGTAGAQFQLLKGRGTSASPLPIISGDIIGNFAYQTRNSGGTTAVAGFHRVVSTAAPSANNTACVMQFGVGDGTAAIAPIVMTVKPTGVDVTGGINSTGPLLAGGGRSLFTANNEAYSVGVRRSAAGGYVYFGATDITATPGIQFSTAGGGAALTISNAGNITSTGTAHSFAANSIAGSSVTDRPLNAITASRAIALTDRSCSLANTSTGAADVVLTIPTNATAAFPIGTTFSIFDLSSTASTILTAAAGVTLNWNGTLTGGAPSVAGGVAASVQIPSPFSRVNLIKTGTDTWAVFN